MTDFRIGSDEYQRWGDGRAPIAEAQVRFRAEAALYARPEELPVVSSELRERVRRGWA